MRSLNKVMLIGHLAADPEIRQTPNGNPVASFSLATNRDWTTGSGEAKKATDFHRIVVWGKPAETVSKYFQKGMGVYLEGRLTNRSYEGKDGNKKYITEIVCTEFNMLSYKKNAEGVEQLEVKDPGENGK